jgi:iron-sulfur cluster assembly protein
VVISKHSAALLAGIELDYVELTPGEFNFIFVPCDAAPGSAPNSASGCGGSCSGGCSGQSKAQGL